MRFAELVEASRSVGETDARLEKIGRLAAVLKRLSPDEIEIGLAFLSGSLRQGRIGLGGAIIAGARAVVPASAPTLDLVDVDAALDRMAGISGPGSSAAKTENLRALLGRATEAEQDFPVRLLRRAAAGRAEASCSSGRPRSRHPGSPHRRAAMMAARRAGRAGCARRRRRSALSIASSVSARPADAGRIGRRHRRGVGRTGRRLARIQARWRAHSGAQSGR